MLQSSDGLAVKATQKAFSWAFATMVLDRMVQWEGGIFPPFDYKFCYLEHCS